MNFLLDLKRNISSNERTLRAGGGVFLMAIGIAALGMGSFFGFLFTLIGAVLVGTSVVSHCPVYQKLDKDTFNA